MILTTQTCNPSIRVSGCFLLFANTFLLLKRKSDGVWGVPAGKIEEGESDAVAMCRELSEETGIVVAESDLVFDKTYYCRHGSRDLSYALFSAVLSKKPAVNLNEEHTDYKWVTPKEALTFDLIEDEDVCIKDFFDLW